MDLDDLESGKKPEFKVLTELPLRYGLNGASVAAHGDFLVKICSKLIVSDEYNWIQINEIKTIVKTTLKRTKF